MLKGVNDSDELALELSTLAKTVRRKINLIPFNPFPGTRYEVSSRNRIYAFQRILLNDGHVVTVRKTRGDDIDARAVSWRGRLPIKRSDRRVIFKSKISRSGWLTMFRMVMLVTIPIQSSLTAVRSLVQAKRIY